MQTLFYDLLIFISFALHGYLYKVIDYFSAAAAAATCGPSQAAWGHFWLE